MNKIGLMKSILILSTQPRGANTGVRVYCDSLESVLSTIPNVHLERLCHMDVSKYLLCFSRVVTKCVSFISVSLGYVIAHWLIAIQTLFLLFRRRKFDIVIAQDPITGFVSQLLGFKTLTICHSSDPIQEKLTAHRYSSLMSWLLRRTMMFFLKRNHHYGVLSKTQQMMMRKYAPAAKIDIVPTICREICCDRVPHEGFRVAMMGRLEYLKGQERLIKALDFLRDLPISVWFIGEGDAFESLQKKAYELNVAKEVYFLGKLQCPEDALLQCDLYVHTSRLEAFSLACIEAIFAGLPTWSFETPGYNDFGMFDETPKLFQEMTAEELANHIRLFYTNKTAEERLQVWKRQREIVRLFEFGAFKTRILTMIGL